MARNYADGRSEALNHQMFICFLRMDFDECIDLYSRIQQSTSNQIELLVSEVNMMMICQRAAQNRLFFDYYNRALERIQRIREEYDEVKGRNKERVGLRHDGIQFDHGYQLYQPDARARG